MSGKEETEETQKRPDPVPVLDYRNAEAYVPFYANATGKMLLLSVFFHLTVFFCYSPAFDDGYRARRCTVVSIVYWLICALIFGRRRGQESKIDRLFLGLGYPVMLVICEVALSMRNS